MKIIIDRIFGNDNKTLSENYLVDDKGNTVLKFRGIELPWKDNQRNISCMPAGIYKAIAVRRFSNGKYALWVQDVPGRSQIMVHTANYVRDLRGCLAPGRFFRDLDKDGIVDVGMSQSVMDELQKHIPLGTEIEYHVIDSWRMYGNKDVELQ